MVDRRVDRRFDGGQVGADPARRMRPRRVWQEDGWPDRGRSGGGNGETSPRSGEMKEAARPCGGRVAEAGQPLKDLFQAVRAEVAECRRRRPVERQVPPGGEDDHLVAAGGVERAARGEHHGDATVGDAPQQAQHLRALRRVECRGGLFEEELCGPGQQFGGDDRALAFIWSESADWHEPKRGQAGQVECLRHRRRVAVFRPAVPRRAVPRRPARQCPGGGAGADRSQLGGVAQCPGQRKHRGQRVTVGYVAGRPAGWPDDSARGRRPQPGHRVKQGCLARSPAANDRNQLTMTNSE